MLWGFHFCCVFCMNILHSNHDVYDASVSNFQMGFDLDLG